MEQLIIYFHVLLDISLKDAWPKDANQIISRLLSQADRKKKKQSKSSTTCVSIRWNKSQLLYASVGSLTVASFFSNQGGGIREKYRFLFILLTFYSKEVIKFYSTLKMSLLHAEKVSCNLKQNQGVASLTNFCDAEPIKKNLILRR